MCAAVLRCRFRMLCCLSSLIANHLVTLLNKRFLRPVTGSRLTPTLGQALRLEKVIMMTNIVHKPPTAWIVRLVRATVSYCSWSWVFLPVQDTAGQERFRTLTPSYYRGAQGVILGKYWHCTAKTPPHSSPKCTDRFLFSRSYKCSQTPSLLPFVWTVYDVTRRDSFAKLDNWLNELETYTTRIDLVKMLVGNKIDKVEPQLPHVHKSGVSWTRSNWRCLLLLSGRPWGGQKRGAEFCQETLDAFYRYVRQNQTCSFRFTQPSNETRSCYHVSIRCQSSNQGAGTGRDVLRCVALALGLLPCLPWLFLALELGWKTQLRYD